MSKGLTIALAILAVVLIGLFMLGGWLLIRDELAAAGGDEPAAAAAAATDTPPPPTATATTAPSLPEPVVEVLPTDTPVPTNTPTETPIPTDTPEPTETPLPTNTPAPVIIPPTNTPPPPPTDTPPPAPPPQDTRGLTATAFSIEGGPTFGRDQQIWFNFTVANANAHPVHFNVLGVYPRKDGALRADLIQPSWGGQPDDAVPPQGLTHRDNIRINEPGNYDLYLAVCFDSTYNNCLAGGGTWVFLSQPISITIP